MTPSNLWARLQHEMSANLKFAYKSTLDDLLRAREFAGGILPEQEESVFVELLDELWWKLNPADQDELERCLLAPNQTGAALIR